MNENPSSADETTKSSAAPQTDNSSNASSAALKYNQSQMDNTLANNASQLKQSFKAERESMAERNKSLVASAVSEATRRANMTAEQKRLDDIKKSRASTSSAMEKIQSYEARDAKRSAIDDTSKALGTNVSNVNDIAPFLADVDPDKRQKNVNAFNKWLDSFKESYKSDLLQGKATPQTSPNVNPADTTTDKSVKNLRGLSPAQMRAYLKQNPGMAKTIVTHNLI